MDETDNVEHMLTTTDNPFNPFTQFDEWNTYDTKEGWHTLSYLGRVVKSSHELSESDQHNAFEQGIQEILDNDVFGVYVRVTADSADAQAARAVYL
jgi:hypothetical protein